MQRQRLVRGLVRTVCERGVRGLSVAEVVARAGVSRRTFYELFADIEDCLLLAFEDSIEQIAAQVTPAYESQQRWQDRVRAGLVALLELLDKDPCLSHFVFVDTLGAGRKVLERRAQMLAQLATVVDRGRDAGGAGAGPPSSLAAEGVVGSVCAVLHSRLLTPNGSSFLRLTEPLMSLIVLPYLGAAATRAEMRRPTPLARTRPKAAVVVPDLDVIKGLGMRITYRTACTLIAVAENPRANNRQIGAKAGIDDQGQMSKLMSRLCRLGLVENVRDEADKGAPNKWVLTPRGEEVRRVIGAF
jgi:AcrR family transcriptional regulator